MMYIVKVNGGTTIKSLIHHDPAKVCYSPGVLIDNLSRQENQDFLTTTTLVDNQTPRGEKHASGHLGQAGYKLIKWGSWVVWQEFWHAVWG